MPDQADPQKIQRVLDLVVRHSSGQALSESELAEIRELHPGFGSPAAVAPPLSLTPEPSPASGDGRVTKAQLDAWSVTYGIQHRQLRRMIERGREKGEPCPLDNPRAMPAWVEKHVEKVRAELWTKVCAAAEAAGPAQVARPGSESIKEAAPTPIAVAPQSPPAGMMIDLATVGGVEGESVELFRNLFAAAKLELVEAYKSGSEEKKRSLHSRLEKLGESLRKHEAAAETKAKRRGELLSRPEVYTAINEALNILRLMREHREKTLLAQLPSLDLPLAAQIRTALSDIGRREEAVLANLHLVKSSDDLLQQLAA